MEYNFDYIITLLNMEDNNIKYRSDTLSVVLNTIPKNIHVIIVEQIRQNQNMCYKDVIDVSDDNVTYIEKYYDGPFVKGWLYNIGVKNSITEKILLAEADNFQEPSYYGDIYHFVVSRRLKWCICWDTLLYLDENRINKLRTLHATHKHGQAEGGLVYFEKYFLINDVGGCSEWFRGLGGIDNDTSWRAHHESKTFVHMPGRMYHFWHPKGILKGQKKDEHEKLMSQNRERLSFLKKYTNAVQVNLRKYKNEIGGDLPLSDIYPDIYSSELYKREFLVDERRKRNKNNRVIIKHNKEKIVRPDVLPQSKPKIHKTKRNRRVIRRIF